MKKISYYLAVSILLLSIALIFFWQKPPELLAPSGLQDNTLLIVEPLPLPPAPLLEPEVQLPSVSIEIPTEQLFPPLSTMRYGFTENDIYLMSVLLTGSKYVDGDGEFDFDKSRSDDQEQISLVLCVVMNRVRSEPFPDTVFEVIWQPNQFSPMNKWAAGLPEVSDISIQKVSEWCMAYDNYDPRVQTIPDNHLYFGGDGYNNHSRMEYIWRP